MNEVVGRFVMLSLAISALLSTGIVGVLSRFGAFATYLRLPTLNVEFLSSCLFRPVKVSQ